MRRYRVSEMRRYRVPDGGTSIYHTGEAVRLHYSKTVGSSGKRLMARTTGYEYFMPSKLEHL